MQEYECPFCLELADVNASEFRSLIPESVLTTRVIWSNERFFSLASFGAFVEGLVLILTKKHIPSFSYLNEEEIIEAINVKNKIVELVRRHYSRPIIFEHGVMESHSSSGSCIDHAHLHVVPCNDLDLFPILSRKHKFIRIGGLQDLLEFRKLRQPYIYYENWQNSYVFLVEENLPSQYVRRILVEMLEKKDEWDWAIYVGKENIIKTVRTLTDTRVCMQTVTKGRFQQS